MSDLHSNIMNLYCSYDAVREYKLGHRDARHAAAELARKHVAKIEQQRDELISLLRKFADNSQIYNQSILRDEAMKLIAKCEDTK